MIFHPPSLSHFALECTTPNKSPEPTAVGAVSSAVRFTSRVGGGSAFYVRRATRIDTMNPEFQLARFLLYTATVLVGCVRLGFWSFAFYRTKRWFLSLLAFSALMNVGFGLVSLAMLWNSRAWMYMLGRSGFTMFYNALLYLQVTGDLIETAGVAFLVVWLCRSHQIMSEPKI